jgi:hypothetical protein
VEAEAEAATAEEVTLVIFYKRLGILGIDD